MRRVVRLLRAYVRGCLRGLHACVPLAFACADLARRQAQIVHMFVLQRVNFVLLQRSDVR